MYSNYNPNSFYGGGENNSQLPQGYYNRERLSKSKNYKRPAKTFQDNLTNDDIKDKLKNYKSVDNINNVQLGTHLRYWAKNLKTGELKFRLGGVLSKRDPDKPYIILDNGVQTWSVQKKSSKFYRKMSKEEERENLLSDVKKIRDKFTTTLIEKDEELEDNRQQINSLKKKLERYRK